MKENQRKCCKCGSSVANDPTIKLYRFPKPGVRNILRCTLWAKFLAPKGLWSSEDFHKKMYSEHNMICSKHFEEKCFINITEKKLFLDAVPTIVMPEMNISADGENLHRNSHIMRQYYRNTKMRYEKCCVISCTTKFTDGITLHNFPSPLRNIDRFITWKAQVKTNFDGLSDMDIFNRYRVCHRHFEDKYQAGRNRMFRNAIPTLNLPSSSCDDPLPMDVHQPAQQLRDNEVKTLAANHILKPVVQKPKEEEYDDPGAEEMDFREEAEEEAVAKTEEEAVAGSEEEAEEEAIAEAEEEAVAGTEEEEIAKTEEEAVAGTEEEAIAEAGMQVCNGCLSTGRWCEPAPRNLEDLLLSLGLPHALAGKQMLLCWECIASLSHAHRLRTRAQTAQKLLAACAHARAWARATVTLEPLTTLSLSATKIDYDLDIQDDDLDIQDDEPDIQNDEPDIQDDETDIQDDDLDIHDDDLDLNDDEFNELVKDEIQDPVDSADVFHSDPASYKEHMTVLPVGSWPGRSVRNPSRPGLRCEACQVVFKDTHQLELHTSAEHLPKSEAPHVCSMCGDNFSKLGLQEHMKEHMFVYVCDVCKRASATEKRMRFHFEREHKDVFKCGKCDICFGKQLLLVEHCLELHYKFRCDSCGREYMAKEKLQRHIQFHH